MEIGEQEWLDLKAELHVLTVLVLGLLRNHEDAQFLIASFRDAGLEAHEAMLSTPMTDAEIEAHRRAHARLAARLQTE